MVSGAGIGCSVQDVVHSVGHCSQTSAGLVPCTSKQRMQAIIFVAKLGQFMAFSAIGLLCF